MCGGGGGIRLLLESFLGHSEIKRAAAAASNSNQESTVCCMGICLYLTFIQNIEILPARFPSLGQ